MRSADHNQSYNLPLTQTLCRQTLCHQDIWYYCTIYSPVNCQYPKLDSSYQPRRFATEIVASVMGALEIKEYVVDIPRRWRPDCT